MGWMQDTISVGINERRDGIRIEILGSDRPNLIAFYTHLLDSGKLYVDSLAFHLRMGLESSVCRVPFFMEILARGNEADLEAMVSILESPEIVEERQKATEAVCPPIDWRYGYSFFCRIRIPDRPGITADIAGIVGKPRLCREKWMDGSFVTVLAQTENSAGPLGGVPYFHLQFQVVTQESAVRDEIVSEITRKFPRDNPGDLVEIITL